MRQQIIDALKAALAGSRKVKITFKQEAANVDVNYLFGMLNTKIIEMGAIDLTVLVAVRQSGRWDDYHNRVFTVTLTEQFDESWFVSRMWRALEKIEVVA